MLLKPLSKPFSGIFRTRLAYYSSQTAPMASLLPTSYIVTPQELHSALKQQASDHKSRVDPSSPRIIPLHAAWFMPNDAAGRTGASSFAKLRIPNARFFDLDAVKHPSSPYPHMLPTPPVFAAAMRRLGIREHDTLVCYDSDEVGLFSAPRAAWTIKQLLHPGGVRVLDNFKVWVEAGLPTASGPASTQGIPAGDESEYGQFPVSEAAYTPPTDQAVAKQSVDFDHVKAWARRQVDGPRNDVEPVLLDARPKGRFDGTAPEPRPGLPSGHVPGSVSMPFSAVLDPITKTLLPKGQLINIFKQAGVVKGEPVISACGTGVTAAILDLALMRAGWSNEERTLYDGSWTEWAQRATEAEGLIVKGEF